MNQSYKDFLRWCWSKDNERAAFKGAISDTKLDQIVQTIWNGQMGETK